MNSGEFYTQVGNLSSPGDLVKIINKDSGATSSVKSMVRETHDETGHSTFWIEVEED